MSKQLPRNASLENLKKQAKQLFKGYLNGDGMEWPAAGICIFSGDDKAQSRPNEDCVIGSD